MSGPSISPTAPTQNATRSRVLANIAASRLARDAGKAARVSQALRESPEWRRMQDQTITQTMLFGFATTDSAEYHRIFGAAVKRGQEMFDGR